MEFLTKNEQRVTSIDVDTEGLQRDLRSSIDGEVRFDAGARALYATDAGNYRQVPIGVVLPKSERDIIQTVNLCREYSAPILARGGGTSLAGQCCNVAVVIDTSKYLRGILEIDPAARRARIQPGVVLDDLRNAAEKYHLTFAPDPATHDHCTLGGMIGNNSCGVHSVMGGKTVDNIEELRVLTYGGLELRVGKTSEDELDQIIREGGERGRIYSQLRSLRDRYANLIRERYPKIPRRVSGYNLDDLLPENDFHVARALVGSEGTCVTVLEAVCRLVESPPVRSLLVLGYRDVYSAADHVTEVLAAGPVALEGLDDNLINDMKRKGMHPGDIKLLPDGGGWLLLEFGGESKEESDQKARDLMSRLKKQANAPSMKLYDDEGEEKLVWEIRESGLGATAWVPGHPPTWPGWEDSAVPPEKLGEYLRDFRKLLEEHHYHGDLYGHFGQGCLHTRIDFDLQTSEGIKKYRSFVTKAAEMVTRYGGSLSGEHGDGQARAELLPIMFGNELVAAFREFKSIWDPEWKMNPGKVVDPYRVDENLRLADSHRNWDPATHFQFPEDNGSFAHAALRCVGVGKCRRESGGTMCPSYMVTHEEEHSTRGRARLLFEMTRGEVLRDKWQDQAVLHALDLCLSCKGCKGDCPVNVDMATYKAEFLSHYYEHRLRPRHAYAIGLIHKWSGIASNFPHLANFFTHAPIFSTIAKGIAGVAQERDIPPFAAQTFKSWFRSRKRRMNGHREFEGRRRVILWADTFNNHFQPWVAQAAVEVLEDAGFQVKVPRARLCCGRPLYDYGMLDKAKELLSTAVGVLSPEHRDGAPVVVLEPSCAAVFRDELKNLFPKDRSAAKLSEDTFLLSEFLDKKAPDYRPPRIGGKALVHMHCHHRAVMKGASEENILAKLGVDVQMIDSGCCGMAGGFGYEKEHYEISKAIGERVLLPAVRAADENEKIIADGFSCRGQISQLTPRTAMHLSELIQSAIHENRRTSRSALNDVEVGTGSDFWEKAALVGGAALLGLTLSVALNPVLTPRGSRRDV